MDSSDEVLAGRVGQSVGPWRLERLIGIGGMAAVYEAAGPDGRRGALKLLHPEMARRPDVRERFLREGRVPNQIDHPGIVKVEQFGQTEQNEAYLVMELLEGESLAARIDRVGALPLGELLSYLDQILDVLAAAHDNKIIHRDLKPDNLFVMNDGRIKVLDFGLARMLDEVPGQFKTRTGIALGTLPYMAPEQALGRRGELDGRVDVFALGATAFRILAGKKVHEAESEAELLMAMASKPAPPLETVAPAVPRDVCAIVDMALAFSKQARYPDARTMQADVRAVIAGQRPPHVLYRRAAREQATQVDLPVPTTDVRGSAPTVAAPAASATPGAVAAVTAAGAPGPWSAPAPASQPAPPSAATAPYPSPASQPYPPSPASQPYPSPASQPYPSPASQPYPPSPASQPYPADAPTPAPKRRPGALLIAAVGVTATAVGMAAAVALAPPSGGEPTSASRPGEAIPPRAAPPASDGDRPEQTTLSADPRSQPSPRSSGDRRPPVSPPVAARALVPGSPAAAESAAPLADPDAAARSASPADQGTSAAKPHENTAPSPPPPHRPPVPVAPGATASSEGASATGSVPGAGAAVPPPHVDTNDRRPRDRKKREDRGRGRRNGKHDR